MTVRALEERSSGVFVRYLMLFVHGVLRVKLRCDAGETAMFVEQTRETTARVGTLRRNALQECVRSLLLIGTWTKECARSKNSVLESLPVRSGEKTANAEFCATRELRSPRTPVLLPKFFGAERRWSCGWRVQTSSWHHGRKAGPRFDGAAV